MITNVLSPVGEMANLLVPVLSSLFHTKVIRSRWLSWWRFWEGGYSDILIIMMINIIVILANIGIPVGRRRGTDWVPPVLLYHHCTLSCNHHLLYHHHHCITLWKHILYKYFFCLSWVSLINLTLIIDFFEGSPYQTKCKLQEANKEWKKSAHFLPLLLYFGQ